MYKPNMAYITKVEHDLILFPVENCSGGAVLCSVTDLGSIHGSDYIFRKIFYLKKIEPNIN